MRQTNDIFDNTPLWKIIGGLVVSILGLTLVKKYPAIAGLVALAIAGLLAWMFLNGFGMEDIPTPQGGR